MSLATTCNLPQEALQAAPVFETINGLPALEIPGPGLLVTEFARNLGLLVRAQGIYRRDGSAFILNHESQKFIRANPRWLRSWIEQHVTPFRIQRGGSFKIVQSISEDAARTVLDAPQFLEQLPVVERCNPCSMPFLRDNGNIEMLPIGFDPLSKTFTTDPGFTIEQMSLAEAKHVLDDLMAEFAWCEDGGRSLAVHIAAMLTVFASGILPTGSVSPVFIYLGNAEGSGKTTLASLAAIPYREAPIEAAPKDEAEFQKKLLALTISGRRLVLFDNLKGHLNSPSLEAYTTAAVYTDRILGLSEEFSGQAGAIILITGNALTVSADLRRRALFVQLFMPQLRAEDRKFRRILDAETIRQIRPRVISALSALVKAWDNAGRPPATTVNASFPRWSQTIAGIVEFAGFGSPLAPSQVEGMGDTDTADIAALAGLMNRGVRYSFAEITSMATDAGLFERVLSDRDNNDELSRAAKKHFSAILIRYGGRRITSSGELVVEGKGKSRRYAIAGHDGHDGHDGKP